MAKNTTNEPIKETKVKRPAKTAKKTTKPKPLTLSDILSQTCCKTGIGGSEDGLHNFIVQWSIADINNPNLKELDEIKHMIRSPEYLIGEYDGERYRYIAVNRCHHAVDITNVISTDELNARVHDTAYEIYGKRYNTISDRTRQIMWYECITKLNEGIDPTIDNPAAIMQHISIDRNRHGEPGETCHSFMMDAINMNALFDCKPNMKLHDLLCNLLSHADYSQDEIQKLINTCVEISKDKIFYPNLDEEKDDSDKIFNKNASPKEIYDLISTNVVRQDAAKKAAAMLVYNHIREHGRNIIMAGPTGCGKTEIWRTLAQTFPFIKIINEPQLTAEGWKGSFTISDIFINQVKDPEIAKRLILVIDEADKIFEPAIASSGTDFSKLIQNELLKLMDHTPGNVLSFSNERDKTQHIDIECEKISVVLCGTFERMLAAKSHNKINIGFIADGDTDYTVDECTIEDLIKYANMRTELVGRVNQIVTLQEMTADNFEEILNHPSASPIKKLEDNLGIKIIINKAAKRKLAEKAVETKLGCRIVHSKLQQCIDNIMFESPDKSSYQVSKPIMDMLKE